MVQVTAKVFTARIRSLEQGNVFTGVFLSVHRGGLCMMSFLVWLPGPMYIRGVSVWSHVPSVWVSLTETPMDRDPPRDPPTAKSGHYAYYWNAFLLQLIITMVDPGGSRDVAPAPFSFLKNCCQNNRLAPSPSWADASSGKSWIRHCMRPETGRFILNLNFDKVMNFDPKKKSDKKSSSTQWPI